MASPKHRDSLLMTSKVLFCIPVYPGVVFSLIFQLVLNAANAAWLMWWLSKSHDDNIELLKTLVSCLIALAIWEFYAAFVALVGLYGAILRKRFMKNFIKPQAFVWVCHVAICVWYIIVYYQFDKEKNKDLKDCREKLTERDEAEGSEYCEHLMDFHTAPLLYVWLTFILETAIQTMVFYFLYHYRRFLNDYELVDSDKALPLSESSATLPNQSSEAWSRNLSPADGNSAARPGHDLP